MTRRKFDKKIWVIIKKCSHDKHCWYYDKINTIHLVTDEVFPPDYVLVYHKNEGLYPMIKKEDAEEITPNLIEKFLLWFKTKEG